MSWESTNSIRAGTRRWFTPTRVGALLIIAGLIWRTARYLAAWPIWGDEAFVAVDFLTRDYADMLKPSQYGQIVPLLFMWGELAICRAFGSSEQALRLLPFVAGVLSLLLYWRLARTTLAPRTALLPIGFFAAAYFTVRHGAEVKPYASDLLISLIFLLLALRIRSKSGDWPAWAALIALAGLGGWASYPAIFCAGGIAIYLALLVWRSRFSAAMAIPWVIYCVALLGGFMVLYITYARPQADFAAKIITTEMWSPTFPPWKQPWMVPVWLVGMHTGLMMAYPYGGQTPGSVATTILAILGAIRLWRKQRDLLLLLLAPLMPTLLAASLKSYPYGGSARTSLYMAPAFCLLAGLGLHVVLQQVAKRMQSPPSRSEWLRRMELGVSTALALFAVGLSVSDMIAPYKSGPVKASHDAARAIAARVRPGDAWVMFNAIERVPYAPYLGDWRGAGGQFVFDALRFSPVKPAWAPRPATVECPPNGRVWLIAYRIFKVEFPEEQWQAYRDAIQARCGTPAFERFEIKRDKDSDKVESVDVYRFGPAD